MNDKLLMLGRGGANKASRLSYWIYYRIECSSRPPMQAMWESSFDKRDASSKAKNNTFMKVPTPDFIRGFHILFPFLQDFKASATKNQPNTIADFPMVDFCAR